MGLLHLSLGLMAISANVVVAVPPPNLVFHGPTLDDTEGDGVGKTTQETASRPSESFSMDQVQNTRYQGQNGLESMIHIFMKYNKPLTPELKKAIRLNQKININIKKLLQKRGNMWGTFNANPPQYFDSEYVVPVKIGTPAQTVYLNLDTGSSDFWTFSTDTPREHYESQRIYSPGLSSTSRLQENQTWSIEYGDGSAASGIVYHDRVAMGQAVVASQGVQSATYASDMFTEDPFSSGIAGMAMRAANTVRPDREPTFFDNVASDLAAPVMTANLQKGKPGRYTFGHVNRLEYEGPIQYVPVYTESIYWAVPIMGYQVGGGGGGGVVRRPWVGIADTGTTLLLVPGYMVDDYYSNVSGAEFDASWGAVVFPCDKELPAFRFVIGLYSGLVPGHYVNYGPVNATFCYGGIQTSDGIGISIIGDVLLKAQFVVFDLGRKRVGFANKALTPPP